MKQLKFREPFKVSLPDDLYQELLELHAQGDMQDAPFQAFVALQLRRAVRIEEQTLALLGRPAAGPTTRSSPPPCSIIDLEAWKRGRT